MLNEEEDERGLSMATTTTKRSKTLHNFSLPNLWLIRRQVRCVKVGDPDGGASSSGGDPGVGGSSSGGDPDVGGSSSGGDPDVVGNPYGGASSSGGDPGVGGSSSGGDPEVGGSSSGVDPDVGGDPYGGGSSSSCDPDVGGSTSGGDPDVGGSSSGGDPEGGGSRSGGNQRLRRRSSNLVFRYENQRWKFKPSAKEGIEEFREKIMLLLDLRNVANKVKESIFMEPVLRNDEGKREVSPPEATAEVRPWNLRKRKAAGKAPISGHGSNKSKELGIEKKDSILGRGLRKDRMRFFYTLSMKEIEEDYMKMMGQRPPRRPKKRPKTIQKKIDMLNPASYITEITEDLYNVPNQAKKRKR